MTPIIPSRDWLSHGYLKTSRAGAVSFLLRNAVVARRR